ncbi:MAG: 2,3-dehydroadipyl-CoA hydratase [Myxococcota bacterium]|nr:2,3-dehydroadipyl-CoA hydratase [Myxococcota bacterium]
MSEQNELLSTVQDGVLTLTINREERRNAMSPAVLRGLKEGLEAAGADDNIRVVVITGAGEKAFSSGGDLGGVIGDGFLAAHEGRGELARLFRAMESLRKPIIARVNGQCLAGGFGLMLACDFAITADDAVFGVPEIQRGLFPMMISVWLRRHLGPKRLYELVLLGDKFGASRALEWGLVNQAVPREQLDEAVAALCGKLKALSPAILGLGKQAIHASQDMTFAQSMEYLHAMLSLNAMTEDVVEGVTAFLEKRPPQWKGR